jgi:cellulose synthase/poly-beta-1,6-N-acetylglucosamine synthase-like glycosyltransferase
MSSSPMIYIDLIVPCYNEEDTVPLFNTEAAKVLTTVNGQSEFIFMDDSSKENKES